MHSIGLSSLFQTKQPQPQMVSLGHFTFDAFLRYVERYLSKMIGRGNYEFRKASMAYLDKQFQVHFCLNRSKCQNVTHSWDYSCSSGSSMVNIDTAYGGPLCDPIRKMLVSWHIFFYWKKCSDNCRASFWAPLVNSSKNALPSLLGGLLFFISAKYKYACCSKNWLLISSDETAMGR